MRWRNSGWTTCGNDHAVDLCPECLQLECETSNKGHELLSHLTSRTRGLRMGNMWS